MIKFYKLLFFLLQLVIIIIIIINSFFYVFSNNYKLFYTSRMLDNVFFLESGLFKPKCLNNTSRPFVNSFFVWAFKFLIEFNPYSLIP